MSTLREITYSIINTIRPKMISGDHITEELVNFHVKNARATLAKQKANKSSTLDSSFVQSLGCIELTLADQSQCCSFPTGCSILRTNVKIPGTLDTSTSSLTRVGPVNLSEPGYQPIEFERVPFAGYNKYTKHLTKWFTTSHDDYIYLLIDENDYLDMSLEVINVRGIFNDPEELSSFVDCSTGTSCFNVDSEYPVPDSMILTIQDIVIKNFLGVQYKQPLDNTNDNKVNPESTITK